MKKIISLIATLLMLMSPVFTAPVYADSHAKAEEGSEDPKKKKKVEEEVMDEEPECD